MGDIADAMLDGTLDCETGEYLGDPCGYPRTASSMLDHEWHGPPRKITSGQKRNARRKRARARKAAELRAKLTGQ